MMTSLSTWSGRPSPAPCAPTSSPRSPLPPVPTRHVCRLADGETLVAVEAKGGADLLRGIAQAELYRRGFHLALLACAGRPPQELLTLARQRSVGVLAVMPDVVELLDLPPAHLPQLRHAERIRRQLAVNVALVSPFTFNVPTHYLAMAPVLQDWAQ